MKCWCNVCQKFFRSSAETSGNISSVVFFYWLPSDPSRYEAFTLVFYGFSKIMLIDLCLSLADCNEYYITSRFSEGAFQKH